MKNTVEICANCGKIVNETTDDFRCTECGSNVCVVVPRSTFLAMIKAGVAKE